MDPDDYEDWPTISNQTVADSLGCLVYRMTDPSQQTAPVFFGFCVCYNSSGFTPRIWVDGKEPTTGAVPSAAAVSYFGLLPATSNITTAGYWRGADDGHGFVLREDCSSDSAFTFGVSRSRQPDGTPHPVPAVFVYAGQVSVVCFDHGDNLAYEMRQQLIAPYATVTTGQRNQYWYNGLVPVDQAGFAPVSPTLGWTPGVGFWRDPLTAGLPIGVTSGVLDGLRYEASFSVAATGTYSPAPRFDGPGGISRAVYAAFLTGKVG
jgi:hypothetical protein